MTPDLKFTVRLRERPRLTLEVDPARLSAAERAAIERLVLEWEAREYG